MQRKYSSYRLPRDLEDLSEFSNPDLRLSPEYAEVEEAYRKIESFRESVEILENSETSYNQSAKAVGTIWPEAYEAFVSMEEALEEIPEKSRSERVMNSVFEDVDEEHGEVETRYRELVQTIEEAKQIYNTAAASLATEIKSSLMLGRDTPLKYAKKSSDSEEFDKRAQQLEKNMIRPENSLGKMARRMLEETGRS